MNIPQHLPPKLTITLWDFCWYTMTMPGEPYADLDARVREAVERGYNAIRICAMPYLLFTSEGKRQGPLRIAALGNGVGQRTRWYNNRGGAELDGHAHLLKLFECVERHDCSIILSSWEYQQTPAFLADPSMAEELAAIAPADRFMTLARSMHRLLEFVKDAGYGKRIAYAELHNEAEYGRLAEVAETKMLPGAIPGTAVFAAMRPYIEEALGYLQERHPDLLITICHAMCEPFDKRQTARNGQVGHYHLYTYGVLRQLMNEMAVTDPAVPFPNDTVKSLLREDAPPFETWGLPEGEKWRLGGNPVGLRLLYTHDWTDPDKWDLYLYERYALHQSAMRQKTEEWLTQIAEVAEERYTPVVIGEGYIGYTPLLTGFEEGPVGKAIAQHAIQKGMELGFWGMVLCSNCAPHHPFWKDTVWQKKWNAYILGSAR